MDRGGRQGQQIALSDLEESKENNGLFELRYDDDRYLPFEGDKAALTGFGLVLTYKARGRCSCAPASHHLGTFPKRS